MTSVKPISPRIKLKVPDHGVDKSNNPVSNTDKSNRPVSNTEVVNEMRKMQHTINFLATESEGITLILTFTIFIKYAINITNILPF